MTTDRPATEPPKCLRCGANWVHRDDYAGLGTPHAYESAEAAQGAAPRAEGLDEPRFTAAEWAILFDAHCDSCMRNHRNPDNIRECFARLSRSSDDRVPESEDR